MTKIIISFTKLIVASAMALLFTSCDWDIKTIEGSGNVTTQNRNITENFTGVEASKGLDVYIQQSEDKAVIVEADDNLQAHIITKVENGILKINSDFNGYRNVASKKITVRMPVITSLKSDSGASLSSINVLLADSISLTAESGSGADLLVEADKIISETGSGSSMSLKGKTLSLELSASGGSSTEAGGLLANEVTAQASSGSSVEVHPLVKLNAKASSGASISYEGSPKEIRKSENSGGSVSN